MQVTPTALQSLFTTFDLRFQEVYKDTRPLFYDKVATVVQSATTQNTYAWVAKSPVLRKWVGERVVHNLAAYSHTVQNEDYELTEELDRNVIEDDQYGLFASINVQMMAAAAARQPDYLITSLLQGGQSTTIYDGQNFFDAAHPVSKASGTGVSGTQQNYWSSGKALTFENYMDVRAKMMSFKGEDGRPFGVRPNLLIVPPALEGIARAILNSDFIAPQTSGGQTNVGTQSNVMKGTADLIVVPELAGDDTTWYLLDTDKPLKPFVFQMRKAPQFISLVNPTDDNVFMRKKFIYGVDMRCAAGFALWFLAAKAVG